MLQLLHGLLLHRGRQILLGAPLWVACSAALICGTWTNLIQCCLQFTLFIWLNLTWFTFYGMVIVSFTPNNQVRAFRLHGLSPAEVVHSSRPHMHQAFSCCLCTAADGSGGVERLLRLPVPQRWLRPA